jgi:hypothetical protein
VVEFSIHGYVYGYNKVFADNFPLEEKHNWTHRSAYFPISLEILFPSFMGLLLRIFRKNEMELLEYGLLGTHVLGE